MEFPLFIVGSFFFDSAKNNLFSLDYLLWVLFFLTRQRIIFFGWILVISSLSSFFMAGFSIIYESRGGGTLESPVKFFMPNTGVRTIYVQKLYVFVFLCFI